MRCTWSTAASFIRRGARVQPPHASTKPFVLNAAAQSASESHAFRPLRKQPTPTSEILVERWITDTATDANMSLLAHAAVSRLLKDREVRNAIYVVNSLRHSPYRGENVAEYIRGVPGKMLDYHMLDFGRPVPSRLSAHALIHGLIRYRMVSQAAVLAEWMMKEGIKLRPRTFHAAVTKILAQPLRSDPNAPRKSTWQLPTAPSVLFLANSLVEDACNRRAVRLIFKAAGFLHNQPVESFKAVLAACLRRGELIVSSLLFVFAVKNWHVRRKLTLRFGKDLENPSSDTQVVEQTPKPPANETSQIKKDLAEWRYLRSSRLFPDATMMNRILIEINNHIDSEMKKGQHGHPLHTSLQALANLAGVLDSRQIPFGDVTTLITTLYSSPSVKYTVWVHQRGVIERVDAYEYFHEVLKRLIEDPPQLQPKCHSQARRVHSQPPLSLHARNSLLHYALRHRLSPVLANKVLAYIMSNPLNMKKVTGPDTATYNILLHAGTTLRQPELAKAALAAMNVHKRGKWPTEAIVPQKAPANVPMAVVGRLRRSPTGDTLYELYTQQVNVPYPSKDSPITPTMHTLSTFIAHHTATGKPHKVKIMMYQLLPELRATHPEWTKMTKEAQTVWKRRNRIKAVQRAVTLGPYFFSTVLTALCKHGATDLVERIWHLAKRAEMASWVPGFSAGTTPWVLPIHAYTTVLQCYAKEARKGTIFKQRRPLSGRGDPEDGWSPTKSYNPIDPQHNVWVRYLQRRKDQFRELRGIDAQRHARELGAMVFEARQTGALHPAYIERLEQKGQSAVEMHPERIPRPDARFYNAALDLFQRQGRYMAVRKPNASPAVDRRIFRRTLDAYRNDGSTSPLWNPGIRKVVSEMMKHGYSVPQGLRHIFIGKSSWAAVPVQKARKHHDDVRIPYMLTKTNNDYRRYNLRTYRTKGHPDVVARDFPDRVRQYREVNGRRCIRERRINLN